MSNEQVNRGVLAVAAAAMLGTGSSCLKEPPPVNSTATEPSFAVCDLDDVLTHGPDFPTSSFERRIIEVYAPKLPEAYREPKVERRLYDTDSDGQGDCETTVRLGLPFEYPLQLASGEVVGNQAVWWERYPMPPGDETVVTWSVLEMGGLIQEIAGKVDEGCDGTEDQRFLYSIEREGIKLKLVYHSRVVGPKKKI